MKKIVELLIKQADIELDELGVDVVSLVKDPAIGYEWFAFSEQQFVEPKAGESEEEYVSRCIPVLIEEGYDEQQAAAICYSTYGEDCTECDEFLRDNPCTEGYVAYGMKPKGGRMVPNCVPVDAKMQFESITDYPEYIKEGAAKGIRLNEAIGNKCATQTGKIRGQQLAQGKPISEETVRRMYSYLSRAMTYFDPSDETACGTVSIWLWGGPDALKWAENKVEQLDKERMSEAMLASAEELGTQLDEKNTVYISPDHFAQESTTVSEVADAVKALDILSKRASTEEAKIVYKYEGPAAQRKFCRAMLQLSRTKVFSREDIDNMTSQGVNAAFNSPIRSGNYDVFRFAGGANCKHHWAEYKMFKGSDNKTILIKTGTETETPSDRSNSGFVNASQKKKAEQWYAIQQNFATVNEDERIVVAPAMVPNVLIRRRNQMGEEYFVYFSKETIRMIAEKFFKNNYQNNTDIDHDGNVTQKNTLLESWIVEDSSKDKSSIYGFEVPEGTWMMSMRINDDETWNKVQNGELRGYSISGNFLELTK